MMVGLLVAACGQPSTDVGSSSAEGTGSIASTSGMETASADPASTLSMTSTTAMDDSTSLDTGDDPNSGPASGGFIYGDPDGNSVSIQCSVWDQDCPRGEKCMPWADDGNSWNATRCTPVADDPAQPGEACSVVGSVASGLDDCEVASMCFYVDDATLEGTCVPFCAGSENDPQCYGSGTTCTIANEGTIILCLATCDPLVQDCAENQSCVGIDDDFVCLPDASGPMGAFGDPCEEYNDCDPGYFCAVAAAVYNCNSMGCCSAYCDLSVSNPDETCPGDLDGQVCLPAFETGEAPPGHTDVGLCAIPA